MSTAKTTWRGANREKVGFRVGQFNGDANPLKIIPNATFGGVTNAANLFTEGRFPLTTTLDTLNFAENLSKTAGRHTLKAGFALERVMTDARTGAIFNGAFDFANNSNNPLNTGYAYANAAMGVFTSYTESSGRPYSQPPRDDAGMVRAGQLEGNAAAHARPGTPVHLDAANL